jgi:hypothetical protein
MGMEERELARSLASRRVRGGLFGFKMGAEVVGMDGWSVSTTATSS